MNNEEILHAGYAIAIEKPFHLKKEDVTLFERCFTSTVRATTLLRVKNANVLKSAIFTVRPLRFYTAYTNIKPVSKPGLLKRLLRLAYPAQKLDRGIWITDEWSAEYYHWFADAMPRLEAASSRAGKDWPVILPDYYAERKYIGASLQKLGFTPFYYNRDKRLLVRELLLPSHTAPTGDTNIDIINILREKLTVNNKTTPHRKIYISRQKAKVRKVENEDAVFELMRKHGYEIHFMEDYSLQQQVALLSETKALIGLHGAGLTNMLFMPAGAQLLELRNQGDRSNNCFFSMAANLHHRYYYLTNAGNKADSYDVEIEVDINALEALMITMEKEA